MCFTSNKQFKTLIVNEKEKISSLNKRSINDSIELIDISEHFFPSFKVDLKTNRFKKISYFV